MISGRYSQILSTSDVPFVEISNSKLKGISRNNNEDRGPITSSTVFHSLKAMQDVHLCMYVCMYVCMHVCINFTVKLKYPCCCFAEAPALIPLQCSLNVDVEVELTHGTRLGMYGKALGYSLDF